MPNRAEKQRRRQLIEERSEKTKIPPFPRKPMIGNYSYSLPDSIKYNPSGRTRTEKINKPQIIEIKTPKPNDVENNLEELKDKWRATFYNSPSIDSEDNDPF